METRLVCAQRTLPPPRLCSAALTGGAFRFLSVNARGTLPTDFTPAEAGQTAYYAQRWRVLDAALP